MKISPAGNNTINFCGLRKVVATALASVSDRKIVATYATRSCPTYADFDLYSTSKKVKQPLYKKIIQLISGKNKVVGTHYTFDDGSYNGVRIFKDGTRLDYCTFKYETEYFGEKMGANLTVTKPSGYKYRLQYDTAYKADGKPVSPTLKALKEADRKVYREFMEKHADQIKNLGDVY